MSNHVITIDTNGRGATLGDFYGIFFEDINHSVDGGLYAQMIQNGSFEFCEIDNWQYNHLTAWEIVGEANVTVKNENGCFDKNPHYASITTDSSPTSGIRNLGYGKGMYFEKGKEYRLSFYAKGEGVLRITIETKNGAQLGSGRVTLRNMWEKHSLSIYTLDETDEGTLGFYPVDEGTFCLDAVELFPKETYKNEIYRKDIAIALEELTPKFMRFPGGCLVHSGELDPESRGACYFWKNSIGKRENRPTKRNNWGYNQSLGIGYYEYFIFCEHIKCEPLPVIPAGWNPHRHDACPIDKMQPWIDDALDLIEFANGDENTVWGKRRCELGHIEPFNLKYLAIGNEEVGEEFPERYSIIAKAVREKHPEIKLIHSAGPFPSGSEYERGYTAARRDKADLIDEHYYAAPEWFLANVHRYDNFPNTNPKVFLGEYASRGNTYYNALAEAAYMTGLENAAHAVSLTCYAPLLCHTDYVNWKPDLIWFDNKRICKTPNYYVQKLFSNNLGDYVLPVDKSNINVTVPEDVPLSGIVEIVSDGAEGRIWDISIKNTKTGITTIVEDFNIRNDTVKDVTQADCREYEFCCKFKKSGGRADKGIHIRFGKKDEKFATWQIGGWENQDSLIASSMGGTALDQHIFSLDTDVEYALCLKVEGRQIKTFINGKLMNDCEDKLPLLEDIYITASKIEKTGEIIIKAVNVKDEPYSAVLRYGKGIYEGKAYSLSGYEKTDVNTLDNELIYPKEDDVSFEDELAFRFEPLSVTVLRCRIIKNS